MKRELCCRPCAASWEESFTAASNEPATPWRQPETMVVAFGRVRPGHRYICDGCSTPLEAGADAAAVSLWGGISSGGAPPWWGEHLADVRQVDVHQAGLVADDPAGGLG